MQVIKHSEVPVNPNPHGIDARMIFGNEKLKIVVGTLQPGEFISPHSTEMDAVFYIVEGKGIFTLGEEQQEVEANSIIFSPANVDKGWFNNSDSVLRFLAIKH
jgi:quercetin dioxygenase-like cupin family protein